MGHLVECSPTTHKVVHKPKIVKSGGINVHFHFVFNDGIFASLGYISLCEMVLFNCHFGIGYNHLRRGN